MERTLAVLGSADPSFLFMHIFLQQFCAPVRTALASSPLSTSKDYRALAEEADRIFLANWLQLVHALLPSQRPSTRSPLLEDTAGTPAVVTARRQHDDGLEPMPSSVASHAVLGSRKMPRPALIRSYGRWLCL